MTKISAFIFDLDGVITDTAEYHYLAWKQLADEEGIPFTREDNEALRGVSRHQSLLLLLKGRVLSLEEMERWMTRKNDYYRAMLTRMTPTDLMPGVQTFLIEAKASNLKLGIASASKNARDVLQNLQILDLFDAIGDGNSVTNPKPAPDLFVWVAGGLAVPTTEAIIVEDAEAGIEAAIAGGFRSIGLGPQTRVGKATVVLTGLAAARIESVLGVLSESDPPHAA